MFPTAMGIDAEVWLGPGLAGRCGKPTVDSISLESGLMDRSSPATSTLRSTIIIAFLTAVLLGCGNASARAVQQQEDPTQDWEVQPALWSPRPILIPRTPSIDSAASDTVTLLDSLLTHSQAALSDSAHRDSAKVGLKKASAAARLAKRGPFNISPSDSALWPVKAPPPLPGSLLPEHRIVAFYGNPLSKRMGILGELPPAEMLAKLDTMADEWRAADPATPVQPALHLIVSVAQPLPGKDGMYRQRSDPGLIEKVYGWARSKGAITFLDIQTGKSTVEAELPALIPFLSRPDVHLGLDPEFNMHYNREGRVPGSKIGTLDARDVNHAIDQ